MTDPHNHLVLDILPKKLDAYLASYFKSIDRSNVQFFICDIWKTYAEIASTFFKKISLIVNKYHYVRQVIWALGAARKNEQKKFSKTRRIYFKRSRSPLIKRFKRLTNEQKQQVILCSMQAPIFHPPILSRRYSIVF